MTGRLRTDRLIGRIQILLVALANVMALLILAGLWLKSRPLLAEHSLTDLLLSNQWRPSQGDFGLLAFLAGTVAVTGVAALLALPLCLLSAIYFAEYAPRWARGMARPLLDLMAGVPSVVYGLWGVLAVAPLIQRVSAWTGSFSSGYCVLAGGVVLAVMIAPVIIPLSMEALRGVPAEMREAALSLGSTQWETVRLVVLRQAFPGLVAAAILGLARAFGETMAVMMVVGNVAQIPLSLFAPAYPLPALIANSYGEMLSVPRYDAALMLAALVLLVVVLLFNALARAILLRVSPASGGTHG